MPDFDGTRVVILQPSDSAIPYQFGFTVCSGATENDGAIPYNLTISSMAVTAHRQDGNVCTTGMISNSSHTGWVTVVRLSYLTSSGAQTGRYHLKFVATLSDASIKEFDFNRVIMRDL
jgi:hypothetical protein